MVSNAKKHTELTSYTVQLWAKSAFFERPLNIVQMVQFLTGRLTMWHVTGAAFRSKKFLALCILDQSNMYSRGQK